MRNSVAEFAGMLKEENGASAVILPRIGTGRTGEKSFHLFRSVAFANDIIVHRNATASFYGLEKNL